MAIRPAAGPAPPGSRLRDMLPTIIQLHFRRSILDHPGPFPKPDRLHRRYPYCGRKHREHSSGRSLHAAIPLTAFGRPGIASVGTPLSSFAPDPATVSCVLAAHELVSGGHPSHWSGECVRGRAPPLNKTGSDSLRGISRSRIFRRSSPFSQGTATSAFWAVSGEVVVLIQKSNKNKR